MVSFRNLLPISKLTLERYGSRIYRLEVHAVLSASGIGTSGSGAQLGRVFMLFLGSGAGYILCWVRISSLNFVIHSH